MAKFLVYLKKEKYNDVEIRAESEEEAVEIANNWIEQGRIDDFLCDETEWEFNGIKED